jgi:hypothetical protein
MPHLPSLPTSVSDQRFARISAVSGKGKVHPRTGHERSEREKRYSSTLSLTAALDGGGWSTPCPGRLTPGNDPVPILHEAGWAPLTIRRVSKISPTPGFDPGTIQPAASPGTPQCVPNFQLILSPFISSSYLGEKCSV